jgi:hypothetical protein
LGSEADQQFVKLFPVLFVAMWIAITTMLGFLSGWFKLQQAYPRGDEPPLLTLRFRSGSMGFGVSMSRMLTLSACRSGLRVGMFRLFGPFERPFLVPWHEIDAEPATSLFVPMVRLRFGRPAIGTLKIYARTWRRLVEAVPDAVADVPPVSRAGTARGFVSQWLVASLFIGSFVDVAAHIDRGRPIVPATLCFGVPAIVIALVQAFRFLQEEG